MTDDQAYNLQIIKKVIISYLDENIPNNENGLNMLIDQCDDLVYKIASKIYTESGHKVDFSEEVNITIQPLFNWWSLSSGDLKDPYYSSDLTIGKLLDWIDTIKNEKIDKNLI